MDVTAVLEQAGNGDSHARGELIQLVYEDLRKLAAGQMSHQSPDHTLTSTALVNEVALKLLSDAQIPTESRAQFFAYASRAMRNLLIDHARSKGRQKRGGQREKFQFEEALVAAENQSEDFLALNQALDALAESQPRKAQVVEMRYFGGMKLEEISQALDVSLATVKRDWDVAKTLLLHSLTTE